MFAERFYLLSVALFFASFIPASPFGCVSSSYEMYNRMGTTECTESPGTPWRNARHLDGIPRAGRCPRGLNSFEANCACCCGCCDSTGCGESCGEGGCGQSRCQSLTWFSGFRYLNFGERFNMSAQRTVAAATESGSYNISTSNHLYGGQLGARIRRTRGRFGWEGSGAAGVCLNNSQQSQSVTDFPNFPLRNASKSGNGSAFVGDTNLSGIYRLNNVWNIRAGYNVIWIQGLALAPNQLDSDFAAAQGGTNLDNGGGMLLHGVNVGIEARY